MPRINRIRVSNIKYDHDKKQMPDVMLNLDGLNSIFLLANGGGKSLLIQLALQTILPNAKMGKRRIADLLESDNYTGHVVVEWLLDQEGEEEHYLCTGFAFTEGYKDQRLRYYNYLFDYNEDANFTIEDLPLIKQGDMFKRERPISYQELKDWVRNNEDKRIQLFERIKDYQSYLRRYRILPEEWENIRDTNASEGGVDQFFAKSKTAEQLVDNLLIPSVENMLFQNKKQKKELLNAFSEHRSMLLEIPKIEANIKDFKVISNQAERVMVKVRNLRKFSEELERRNLDLVNLAKTFEKHIEEAEEKLVELDKSKEKLKEEELDLQWKEKSYKAFRKKLEYQAALKTKAKAEDELREKQENLEQVQQKEREVKALHKFKKVQRNRQDKKRYEYELESLDKKAPELRKELKAVKRKLALAWQEKDNDLKERKVKEDEKIKDIETEISDLSNKVKDLGVKQNSLQEERAKVIAWFDAYEETREDLKNYLTEWELFDPEKTLKEKEERIDYYQQARKDSQVKLKKIKEQEKELEEEIVNLHSEESATRGKLDNIKEKLLAFKEAKQEVQGLLMKEGKYSDDLLVKKEDVLLKVNNLLKKAREKRVSLQAELANLEEKWALFADRDYYLPHHELLRIKNILEKRNIFTVLGSEWLANQQLSIKEKEAYLRNQPLLPYSILVEENQLDAVENTLRYRDDISQDIPLLFLVKNAKSLATDYKEEQFLTLEPEQLLIYQPDSTKVFSSQKAFNEFKDDLEDKIERRKENLRNYREREEILINLKGRVEEFYRHYNLEKVQELKETREKLERKIETLKSRLDSTQQEKEELGNNKEEIERRINNYLTEERKLERVVDRLQELVKDYRLLEAKQKEKEEFNEEITAIKNEVTKLESKREELREDKSEVRQRLNESNRALEVHQEEYQRYELEDIQPAMNIEKSYSELKSESESIESNLNDKQGERATLQELITKFNEALQTAKKEIAKTGISEDWLLVNQREVTEEELEMAKQNREDTAKEFELKKEDLNQASNKVETIAGILQSYQEDIKEEFGKEAYFDYSEATHQDEYQNIKYKLEELAKKVQELEAEIDQTAEWKRDNQEGLDTLEYRLKDKLESLWPEGKCLTKEEWNNYDSKPKRILRRWLEKQEEVKQKREKQKRVVDNQFKDYLRELKATKNPKVKQFIRKVQQIMERGRIYDYDYVETQFIRILEGLEEYQKNYQHQLAEREKDMEHLTNLCLRRARTIYDSVMELPKNSRVDLYDRQIQVIKMEWHILAEEKAKEAIYKYLEQVLADLKEWKKAGKDDDEIDNRMGELLRTRNLINIIAPINDCRVRVYKPRKESIVRQSQLDYSEWNEVARWSGGEEYSIYITMFMIMISHIRQQIGGQGTVWKAILADNPFGKASSPHILETVFEVARSNKIQLICFTAHRQENILKEFPVVYSLQLRNAYGKEVMQAERLETAFYNLGKIE
jgi:chromosome segregation ATPase